MKKAIALLLFLPIFLIGQNNITICDGDSAFIYGNWQNTGGIYTNGGLTTTLVINPLPIITPNFVLNGNAQIQPGNVFQLTSANNTQSGSVWNNIQINLNFPFHFNIDVFLGCNNGGADGIAFVLQPISTSIGSGGGGLGYAGITPSFAVEFDTWQNTSDPSHDHIAIQRNGVLNHNGANNLAGPIGFPPNNYQIEDCNWHSAIFKWDPATQVFSLDFDGYTNVISYSGNIINTIFGGNPMVYWGLTAATGGANNVHKFRFNYELNDVAILCQYDSIQVNSLVIASSYTYLWSPNYNISNNTASSPYFNPDTTTTYSLEITNSYGCTYVDSFTVNVDTSASVITFPLASEFCIGSPPINLNYATPIGGNYLVNSIASTIFNPTINDIGINTIEYSYTSPNGCSNALTNNINVYDSPSVLCTPTNASCNGFLDGSASLTISGGTPTYTTNWGGNNPLALAAGTYGYTVIDNNNCTYSDSIIIYQPGVLTSSINTTNVICNGDNNGTASLQLQGSSTPAGTVSTLSYCSSSPGSNTFSNIENIQLIGDSFSIINNTTNLCDQYEDYTTTHFADLTEGQVYTIDVDLGVCNSGNITNYPSGAKVFIDWNIDGDFTDPGEEVGSIANGIAVSASLNITVPFTGAYGPTRMRVVSQFQSAGNTNPITSCDVGTWAPTYIEPWFGATEDYSIVINSATITATYLWNTLSTSDSIFNLTAGIYSVDITDGNGCTITDIVTITEPTAISVIPTISDINCFNGNDGGIELNIAGGTPNYTISVPPYSQILTGGISNFFTPNILSSGNYPYIITDSSNCSYSGNITLNNPNPSTSITSITSCDSYSWNGTTYTTSVVQIDTLINQNNCDSIATLNLTITNSSLSNTTVNECDSYLWNGTTYTTSGLYDSLFTNSANCDSIASLILTINYSSSSASSNTSCDSYLWGISNQTYINSGIYTQVSTNNAGCIQIDSLILNINNSVTSSTNLSSCDSYLWNSNNYLISGIYTDTLTTSFGCDSIATLNLTITDTSYLMIAETECTSYLWPITNTVYINSGTYIQSSFNVNGCTHIDSLILVINNPTASYDTISECNSYSWNGITFNTSGDYNFNLINSKGCDSIANLNLTISNSTSSSLSVSECDSYFWEGINYNMSGTYMRTLNTINGCDSVVTLSLIIISGGFEITTNIDITDVDCFGMNNGTINLYPNGGISPLTFNWDNGATTQNINSLTAGNYSFTITDSIGCTLDSTVSVSEPDKLIVSFQANDEICRNDSISILIELSNPIYNYYTVQFYDSIQKSFIIDSSGVLIPEGIPFYIIPSFSNQIQLISVTDNNGCTSDINQPLDIIVNEFPILEINQDDICVGTPSFILNTGTPEGGNYFIDDENTNFFDVENLENGAYTIRYEYTDIITNCSNSIEKIININPNPIAEFSFSPQLADIDNPTILFVNESENIENTKWSLGDGTNLIDELEFLHTYTDTGTYDVIYAVSNQFNCSDTATATLIINPVYQIFIPSAFTPNNDGHNDNFKLEIIGQKEYTMTIFNRWGEIIFKEKNGIWDGKINNNIVQNGTYSYSILVSDFKDKAFIYTGIVSLIK